MCGIAGYVGDKKAAPIIINGIKRLDYRGYDSAGIALCSDNNIFVEKTKGRIDSLKKKQSIKKSRSLLGIGHTRWATHGSPSLINAHPHLSNNKKHAVVHNGIIENYQTLKKFLIEKGFEFYSQTDTEVIPNLIEHFYDKDIYNTLKKILPMLEGTFGLAFISSAENRLIAARKGSPLIIGIIKRGSYILASDVNAIVEHTKNVVYLNDGDIAVLENTGFRIKNIITRKRLYKIEKINWHLEDIEKKGYKHFMLKEIFEQPESLRNAFRGKYDQFLKRPKFGGLNIKDSQIKRIKRIIFLACGTSWHSGMVAEYFMEHIAGISTEVEYASEFICKMDKLSKSDLVITISQSGETYDTICALNKAKKSGVLSLGIVNSVGSTIARLVNGGIYIHAGPEIGVASTKAYTGNIVSLYLLAVYFGVIKNKVTLKRSSYLVGQLKKIPQLVKKCLEENNKIKELAYKFKDKPNFIYLGRGINFPTALEGALKLKEISYIHSEGFPAAEMKHGPIALVDKNMPVVFIVKKDESRKKILNNIEEIKARKGIIITIAEKDDKLIQDISDYTIKVPRVSEQLSPIINIIPLQLLAYYIAFYRKCDIDKPRNLAKSVTVE